MIPIHSKIGQGMRTHFGKLVNLHGMNELILVYLENIIFNFYLNLEVKPTETNDVNNALQSGNEYGRQCARTSNESSESRCCTNG